MCIGNRRLQSHEILSEIDANDDTHHSTILDEPSDDVHAVGRLIEMPWLVDTVYNSGSLIETKPQSKLNPSLACLLLSLMIVTYVLLDEAKSDIEENSPREAETRCT
ncbi:MAG: hypothetical protein ABSF63_15895 [Candidatus Bathyarchaeia archaeon]